MADYRSPGTKMPNIIKMFGGWGIIFLAIITGGQLYKLLIMLFAILLIICCPRRKPVRVKAMGNGKKKAKTEDEASYPNPDSIRQMVLREDAMSALRNLGYNKTEAKAAVDAVSGQGHTTLEALVMAALRQGRV